MYHLVQGVPMHNHEHSISVHKRFNLWHLSWIIPMNHPFTQELVKCYKSILSVRWLHMKLTALETNMSKISNAQYASVGTHQRLCSDFKCLTYLPGWNVYCSHYSHLIFLILFTMHLPGWAENEHLFADIYLSHRQVLMSRYAANFFTTGLKLSHTKLDA